MKMKKVVTRTNLVLDHIFNDACKRDLMNR